MSIPFFNSVSVKYSYAEMSKFDVSASFQSQGS